ncbi:MAG: glycosyltransferase family 1 protein [candidate division WOR-3 bacterium]
MNKPIKILQVFGRMDRGGAETLIMNIYRNIDRNKIQFDFLVHTQDKCAYDDEILSLGGRIFRVPRYKIYNHFQYVKSFQKLLKENEWEIIHFHFFTMMPITYSILKSTNSKIIVHSHTSTFIEGFKGFYQKKLLEKIKKYNVYKLACSKKAGEFIFNKDDFLIFNNGIDTKNFSFNPEIRKQYRKELNIQNKIVMGHVGSIYEPKNHSFLIDVFFEFQKKRKDSVLILVGDGHLKEKIKSKIKQSKLDEKVILLGVREDVYNILNSFDFFVFPSLFEGLPVTLIEAQNNGLKCIISDRITKEVKITDLVDFLPLEKSAKYWAEHIANSLNYERKDRSEEIRKAGYDIKENTKWLENFYLELVNKK